MPPACSEAARLDGQMLQPCIFDAQSRFPQPHAPRVCRAYIKSIPATCKWEDLPYVSRRIGTIQSSLPGYGLRPTSIRPDGPVSNWHGQQGSNLRPAVLETAALPTELCPFTEARDRIALDGCVPDLVTS